MNYVKSFLVVFIVFLFKGCGGGSGSSSNLATVTGILLDSAISGVTYSCGSKTGVTDSLGQFTCDTNSVVSFSIGAVTLGSMNIGNASQVQNITPARLYSLDANNITNTKVIKFLQLVQSLDHDSNPDNGIEITIQITDSLAGYSLDITDDAISESDLTTLLDTVSKTIVPKNTALNHYKDTLENKLNIELSPEPYLYQQWYLKKNTSFYVENSVDDSAHINSGNILNTYTGNKIKIAIIDDGLDVTHEELDGAIINSYDITSGTSNVSQIEDANHGTAVTGIIASRQNGLGIQGVASNSEIIFLKYKEPMSDSQTIELFNKAEEFGADIINCSWGTGNVSQSVKDKIIDLANNGRKGKGTIIVFATGNSDQDMGNDESNIPEVISVGATDKDNLRTWYSDFGNNLDIVAPGGYYLGITTLDAMGTKGVSSNDENYLLYHDSNSFIGTSASAPIVSGIVALMLEKNPNLSRVEVENILKNNADKIGNVPYENSRNNYYGYGKVNLLKIINSVI